MARPVHPVLRKGILKEDRAVNGKMILGILIGIAGAILLASIVVQASYLGSLIDDIALRFVLSIVGLGMIQIGYRLVTSKSRADKAK